MFSDQHLVANILESYYRGCYFFLPVLHLQSFSPTYLSSIIGPSHQEANCVELCIIFIYVNCKYSVYIYISLDLVWSVYLCLLLWSVIYILACTYIVCLLSNALILDVAAMAAGTFSIFVSEPCVGKKGEGAGGPLPWHWGATKTAVIGSIRSIGISRWWVNHCSFRASGYRNRKTDIQSFQGKVCKEIERCVFPFLRFELVFRCMFEVSSSSKKELNIAVDNVKQTRQGKKTLLTCRTQLTYKLLRTVRPSR